LTVIVSPNSTSYPVLPINATDLQSTGIDQSSPGEAMELSMAQDSTNTARPIVTTDSETPTDRLLSEMSTPMPPAADPWAGMSSAEKALHDANEAMPIIDLSNAWEGALERIKWVMDTVSPVAEVRYNVL